MSEGRLPNFMIPGAAKSGTTSLYHYLASHPQCSMSTPKETYFFSKGYSANDIERYLVSFEHVSAGTRAIGEASPTYLSNPAAPGRIYDLLGSQVKFVFLLRNPADRAVSAYWHVLKLATDKRDIATVLCPPASDLYAALQWEQRSLRQARLDGLVETDKYVHRHDDPTWNFQYLRNSTYLGDLRRYEAIFGRRQMMIVLSEELMADPRLTFARVAEFLKIDATIAPSNLGLKFNESRLVKPGLAWRWLRGVLFRIPQRVAVRKALLEATQLKKPLLEMEHRRRLAALFSEHNRQLGNEFDVDTQKYWL